jgi:hypothetical protein
VLIQASPFPSVGSIQRPNRDRYWGPMNEVGGGDVGAGVVEVVPGFGVVGKNTVVVTVVVAVEIGGAGVVVVVVVDLDVVPGAGVVPEVVPGEEVVVALELVPEVVVAPVLDVLPELELALEPELAVEPEPLAVWAYAAWMPPTPNVEMTGTAKPTAAIFFRNARRSSPVASVAS